MSNSTQNKGKALTSHNEVVLKVSAQVKASYALKKPFRIYHGHTNSTRQNVLQRNSSIDVSMLDRVLCFDMDKKSVLVEPNVAMDSLVQATLKYGLIPPVVPEFPGITVGGAYAGTAGESSSFKWGFFDRSVRSVEVVLANGTIVSASAESERELFERLPSTMGTLGVVTAVEVELIEAKRYVKTEFVEVKSMEEATEMIKSNLGNGELDFLDGIMFSPSSGAVVMGRLTNSLPPGREPQRFSCAWDPWYYMHVQERISNSSSTGSPPTEYIPLADYLFRYDRGGFWVGRSAFTYMKFPFNRLTRWFLDDFLHTRMLYRALHASKNVIGYVVQDLALPYETAAEFVKFTDEEFEIYPLWLCPLKESPEDVGKESFHPWLAEISSDGVTKMKPMLNIGLWGLPPPSKRSYKTNLTLNHHLETTLTRLRGLKWLYSRTYYTSSQFWSLYPRDWYDALRTKYNATHLPDVWQKVHVDIEKEGVIMRGWKAGTLGIWPIAGLYGVWKGMWSWDWRIARRVKIGKMDLPEEYDKDEKKNS